MNAKELKQIEIRLFELMQKEVQEKQFLVDSFVNEHPVEVGKILFTRVKEESFVQNPFFFPIIFQQVLPHIDDEFYIPTLLEIIKHEKIDPRIRLQTTRLLGWRREESQEAILYLLPFLNGESDLHQITAIALAEIGYEKFEELIPALLVALKKGLIYQTRMNAARLLLRDKSYLEKVLPHLVSALETDSDYRFRQKIARYFGEINNPIIKKVLLKVKETDKHPIVRSVAMTSLEDLEKM